LNEQEIEERIYALKALAGDKVLAIDSFKDFASVIFELVFIDGNVKALEQVLNKKEG
jgi:hypothetical protein